MPDSIPRYTDILHVHYEVEDDDDGGEEEEEEDDEETDDGEETVEGHAEEDADYVPEVVQSPRASQTGTSGSAQARVSFWVEEEVDKRRRTEGGEASSSRMSGIGMKLTTALGLCAGRKFSTEDVEKLFASPIVAPDGESQKELKREEFHLLPLLVRQHQRFSDGPKYEAALQWGIHFN